MRAIVGLQHPGEIFRLLWLSESKSGIYVGYFNGVVDTHVSYHRDGTRHFRIAKSHHQRWKDVPLNDHVGVKQLLHSSISAHAKHDPWPRITSPRDETILLDSRQLSGYDTLAVDTWLSDTGNESMLTRRAEQAHLESGFRHISLSNWRLSSFPHLLFAISFWGGNTHVPVEA